MDIESALASLKASDGCPPAEAVRGAVSHVEAVAPAVCKLLDLVQSGEMLTKPEENLVFSGLYALAEARCSAVFPSLIGFSTPVRTLWKAYSTRTSPISTAWCIRSREPTPHPSWTWPRTPMPRTISRSAAIAASARLVADGRADRERFLGILDDFDRDKDDPAGEWSYFSWAEAILALRFRDFIPRVRQAYDDELMPYLYDSDWQEWLDAFKSPEPRFESEYISTTRPVPCRCSPSPTAAGRARVSPLRLGWLNRVLMVPAATGKCIPFEMVDGLFTGLLCAPEPRLDVEAAMCRVWTDATPDEIFPRPEVRDEVLTLLRSHYRGLDGLLKQGTPPEPFLDDAAVKFGTLRGKLWSLGFAEAIAVNGEAWKPLLSSPAAQPLIQPIVFVGMSAKPGRRTGTPNCRRESASSWAILPCKSANSGPRVRPPRR